MSLPLPPAGGLLAVVVSVRTEGRDLCAAWPEASSSHRVGIVPPVPRGAPAVPLGHQLAPAVQRLKGGERPAWLDLAPELSTRLEQAWRSLAPAERYLAGVARALLDGSEIVLLDRPGGALPAARLRALTEALAARGIAAVCADRRLRLLATLADDVWLADRGTVEGPIRAADLVDDARAWTLCFGGTLELPVA